jgi:hypothetical protein
MDGSKEKEIIEEKKLEDKGNIDIVDNSKINNEKESNGKPTEETLIISENKAKTTENNELNSNKNDTFSPLIDDNIYLNNKLKDDHYILIERTKFLNIPYFEFGFTTHFYFPSEKLQSKMKLSEIPNPPFTIGPDGKLIYIIICI